MPQAAAPGGPGFRVLCEGWGFHVFSRGETLRKTPIAARLRAVHCDSISTPQRKLHHFHSCALNGSNKHISG